MGFFGKSMRATEHAPLGTHLLSEILRNAVSCFRIRRGPRFDTVLWEQVFFFGWFRPLAAGAASMVGSGPYHNEVPFCVVSRDLNDDVSA